MLFMNDYEIQSALRSVDERETPNLAAAVVALARLADWADANSDGWHSWPKPCRAAKNLQALIQSVDRYRPTDVTAAEVKKAMVPVRSFLTRQGVDPAALLKVSA